MFGKKIKNVMLVALALFLLVALTACGNGGGKSIRVADFVNVDFYGVDGKGYAGFSIDEEEFAEELLDKYEKKLEKITKDHGIDEEDYAEAIASFFEIETNAENLRNGDKITYEIKGDSEIRGLEEYGIKFDFSSGEAIVSGLKEVETVDVFENLDISFSGISPNLTINLDEKDSNKYPFSVGYEPTDYSYNYKIGDTVEIEAIYNADVAEENGYAVLNNKKTITIEESMAAYYATSASQLNFTNKNEIKAEADLLASETFTGDNIFMKISGVDLSLGDAESVTEVSFYKAFLASSDAPTLNASLGVKANNFICMVYRFKVNNAADAFNTPNTYNDYAYAYIFLPNVSVHNGTLNYNLNSLGCGDEAYTNEMALKNYLNEYNYTCEEFVF